VRGLSTNLQFVVFGLAIAAGMVISGDRVVAVLGRLVGRPGVRAFLGMSEDNERRGEFAEAHASLQQREAEIGPR
jgi:hypothetical protein